MAWLLSTPALPSRQVNIVEKLVNEFFTCLEDITLSPGYLKGWRIFLSDCCHLCTENPFKNSCSRQLRFVNAVVTLIASRSDRLTEICFSPNSTHFETMMTIVDEASSDKTKVLDEFIFRSVLLDCFTAELDE